MFHRVKVKAEVKFKAEKSVFAVFFFKAEYLCVLRGFAVHSSERQGGKSQPTYPFRSVEKKGEPPSHFVLRRSMKVAQG